jgi:hypothetical protein
MKTNEERLRRLELWNRFFVALLALAFLGTAVALFLLRAYDETQSKIYALHAIWLPGGEIKFSATSDGPFIVTHLVVDGGLEPEKKVARLPQPIAIIDSHGAVLSKTQILKLAWVDIYGQTTAAPKAGSVIKALYYRPQVAAKRE